MLRPFERLAIATHLLRGPFQFRLAGAAMLESELREDDADFMAPNPSGLPEADLTEEQRQEAIRRIKNRPRIG